MRFLSFYTDQMCLLFLGQEVMPNTAIPAPYIGSDDKEQTLNIGKHPSLVKVVDMKVLHDKCVGEVKLKCLQNMMQLLLFQGSQKKMQAAVKRKQQEQGEIE